MTRLARAWRDYWFTRSALLDLAVARIAIVGYQLYWIARSGYRAELLQRTTLPNALYHPLPVLHLLVAPAGWNFRPGTGLLELILAIAIVAGVFALVGLLTNAALVVFAAGCAFVQAFQYSFGDYHHPQAVLIIALGLLALSPAGRALSVDDLRRRLGRARKAGRFLDFRLKDAESEWAGWPLKLTGWVFVLVYASAAYSKLHTAGLDWTNGYTLGYSMLQDAMRWHVPLGKWLAGQHLLMVGLSWMSLFFESTFVLTMVVPVTRWLYVPLGAALHTGIYLTMKADFLGYVAAYSVFVPWRSGLERLARRFGRSQRPAVVLYDAGCPLCIRSVTFLRYWDWLERLELRPLQDVAVDDETDPEALHAQMHTRFPDGTVEKGFFALRRLLGELPPLWPLRPLFYLPGAAAIGPRVYAAVARRRRWCVEETCEIHGGARGDART